MAKVGIMTFHRANNYGAVLQAYALQKTLEQNHETVIIDYRSKSIERRYHKKGIKQNIRYQAKLILKPTETLSQRKKNKKFDNFRDRHLKLSKPYDATNISQSNELFDMFIAGSDQVWNNRIINSDWNYFLSFANPEKCFSYAASFGGDSIDTNELIDISRYLLKFSCILVREKTAFKILEDCGIEKNKMKDVADPVFLLSKKEWVDMLHLDNISKEEYILVYCVAKGRLIYDFARSLSAKTGYNIKFINLNSKRSECPNDFENIMDAGPIDFLNLILNAKCVITTSFHALAFSLIFNKPFYYELNNEKKNNNSRLENIASIFNIQNRAIDEVTVDEKLNTIDWGVIDKKIELYNTTSRKILFNSLHGICNKE